MTYAKNNSFGLPEHIVALLKNYFLAHSQIIKVIIYGSRAMGREQPGSDIDLAIVTNTEEDLSYRVHNELEALSTPYLFDVIDYKRITHKPLQDHIDRVGKIFFKRSL